MISENHVMFLVWGNFLFGLALIPIVFKALVPKTEGG